ncbi:MAG: purine-binding chemotaxis protein CheW [Clostridiales bacterium]|nr:purine-binding chemotaxis protein CheW [Clostridiales bacterium]
MSSIRQDGRNSTAGVAAEILRRRAESLAAEAVEDHADDRIPLLLFRLGEEWYAVKVADVREIFQDYTVTPIPCVPDSILGVVNIRGEIISVTEVATLMGLGAADELSEEAPAIVIQNDEATTAMVIDEIGDIVEVPSGGVEPPLSVLDKTQAEYVAGSVYVDGRLIGLFNTATILRPIDAAGT